MFSFPERRQTLCINLDNNNLSTYNKILGEPDPDEQLVHKRSPSVSTDLSAGKPASRCSRRRSISNNSQKSESSEPGNSRKVKGSSKSLSGMIVIVVTTYEIKVLYFLSIL